MRYVTDAAWGSFHDTCKRGYYSRYPRMQQGRSDDVIFFYVTKAGPVLTGGSPGGKKAFSPSALPPPPRRRPRGSGGGSALRSRRPSGRGWGARLRRATLGALGGPEEEGEVARVVPPGARPVRQRVPTGFAYPGDVGEPASFAAILQDSAPEGGYELSAHLRRAHGGSGGHRGEGEAAAPVRSPAGKQCHDSSKRTVSKPIKSRSAKRHLTASSSSTPAKPVLET